MNDHLQSAPEIAPELFLRHAPMFVAYIDDLVCYRYVNQRYADLLGFRPEEMLGRHVRDVLGEELYSSIAPHVTEALRGETASYRQWVKLPRLGLRFVNTIYTPHLVGGTVSGFFAYGLDITEQRRLEEAQQESDRKYRAVFENAAVGIVRAGPDGEWLEVNDRFCTMLGYDREEVLALNLKQVTHPDDLAEDLRLLGELYAGERDQFDLEKRYRRKDGTVIWASLTVSCIRDGEGQPLYAVGIVSDITARKRAEEEVRKLNLTLEQRIERRTAELSALNEELDAFNYSVSHDLRAPLRGIDGFSSLLEEEYGETIPEEARGYLERVRASATRMGQLLDALLTLSRMTRGGLNERRVSLSGIARETVSAIRQELQDREVTVEVEEGLEVCADESLLRILLRTLLDNAWKFTRDRSDASVRVGCDLQGSERVYYVSDNGAGFDERYADKLFVPFQRLHSPKQFEGRGVGLATAQRIVHRHQGRIWAKGAVGQGATFYFTLPDKGCA
ncbi:MAG TPA: PAS domain S-box protein [Trueperaceae bacterium]